MVTMKYMWEAYFSHPNKADIPTSAALSSGFKSLPFPGPVRLRSVDSILAAIGMAGWVADGNRG